MVTFVVVVVTFMVVTVTLVVTFVVVTVTFVVVAIAVIAIAPAVVSVVDYRGLTGRRGHRGLRCADNHGCQQSCQHAQRGDREGKTADQGSNGCTHIASPPILNVSLKRLVPVKS